MARKKPRSATEDGALALIEKGFNLLKDTPSNTLACYLIGTLPFCLAFIYFWMDMSRSPFAGNHQVLAAAGMAFMFFWMKCWQAIFVKRLSLQVQMAKEDPLSFKERVQFTLRHAMLQGTGLLMIPLSICLLIPFGWAYAFYQNCLYYGADAEASTGQIVRRSAKKAALWPMQNHVIIWLINPLILFLVCLIILVYLPNAEVADNNFFMFAYFLVLLVLVVCMSPLTVVVALNLLALIILVPTLMRMLLGIETAASQNLDSMMNSSTLMLLCCLVYLALDPLVKATYVLRCFYGDAILSGEDVRAGLLRVKASKALTGFLVALMGWGCFAGPESALADQAEVAPPTSEELRRNIDEELEKPIYSWRLPRERKQTNDNSIASTLDAKIEKALERLGVYLERLARRIIEWLDSSGRGTRQTGSLDLSWGAILQSLGWLAAMVLLVTAIVMVFKHFKPPEAAEEIASPQYMTPDLEDENISAEDLPVDEWVALALDMLQKGETRLAVRALFLSGLAFLGEKRLLQIRRFKSNREYLRELARRSHVHGELTQAFEWSVNEFEGIWYGEHEATVHLFEAFQSNLQTIKQDAAS